MFRRLFWLMIGVGFGFGTSFWMMRLVRETVARYTPERISTDVTDALRRLSGEVQLALAEGREAMRDREAQLRAELDRTR